MNTSNWFDNIPVLGNLSPEEAAAKLHEVGEDEAAQMLEMAQDSQDKSNEWVYHPASGQVVNKANPQQLIPYNYLVFGISRYEGA